MKRLKGKKEKYLLYQGETFSAKKILTYKIKLFGNIYPNLILVYQNF